MITFEFDISRHDLWLRFNRASVHLEFRSVTRGRHWADFETTPGSVYCWLGRIHGVASIAKKGPTGMAPEGL